MPHWYLACDEIDCGWQRIEIPFSKALHFSAKNVFVSTRMCVCVCDGFLSSFLLLEQNENCTDCTMQQAHVSAAEYRNHRQLSITGASEEIQMILIMLLMVQFEGISSLHFPYFQMKNK